MERPEFDPMYLDSVISSIRVRMQGRLAQKGLGLFASHHETLGIVTEEYHELVEAVGTNQNAACERELMDLAVACILGIGSMYQPE